MSKRIMVSIVTLLAAVALTAALAYSGFNTFNGTGVLGVGQVQPPGRGQPPEDLSASATRITSYEWDCVVKDDYLDDISDDWPYSFSYWGTVTQKLVAEAIVKMNRHGKVQNYTFVGWVDDGLPVLETDQPNMFFLNTGYPGCGSNRNVVITFEQTVVDDVSFSY